MKLLLSVLMIFSMIFCASANSAPLPSWVLHPPSDNENFLYGVGQGTTNEEVVTSALNSIASKLEISINSSFTNTEELTVTGEEKSFSKQAKNLISANVGRIKFSGYEIVSNCFEGNQEYALIKIDKKLFIRNKIDELVECIDRLERVMALAKEKTLLQSYLLLKKNQNILQDAQRINTILYVLDNKSLLEKMKKIATKYNIVEDGISNKIKICVVCFQTEDKLKSIVENFLNNSNLKLVRDIGENDTDVVIVNIVTKITSAEIYNSKIVKMSVLLEVMDVGKTVIKSTGVESKGVSVISFDQAKEAAIVNFSKALATKNVYEVLGLN